MTKPKKRYKIGIEIECLTNGLEFSINPGHYHSGRSVPKLTGWKAETDSSMYANGEFVDSQELEFVSTTCSSKKAYFKLIDDFKEYFSKNGTLELDKALAFNKSCGSHVHISLEKHQFSRKTIFKVLKEVRTYFMRRIDASGLGSIKQIKKHYFRSFCRRSSRDNYLSGRRKEWNFESEWSNKGLEWRSLNMLGITTWEEFQKYWEIVFDSLMLLRDTCEKYDERRTVTIKPKPKKKLKNTHTNLKLNPGSTYLVGETIDIKSNNIFADTEENKTFKMMSKAFLREREKLVLSKQAQDKKMAETLFKRIDKSLLEGNALFNFHNYSELIKNKVMALLQLKHGSDLLIEQPVHSTFMHLSLRSNNIPMPEAEVPDLHTGIGFADRLSNTLSAMEATREMPRNPEQVFTIATEEDN